MTDLAIKARMKIQLLGSPIIHLPNHLTPTFKTAKAEALFYYLAATQKPYSRAALATLFWGDMAETKARVNLSKALSELREQVGEYVIISTQTVAFNATLAYQLDVESLLTPAQQGNEAFVALQAQVDLYRGEFLEGFYVRNAPDFEQWLLVERERLRSAAVQLFDLLATRYQQSGQLTSAISTFRRLLQLEPWREEIHYRLMQLLVHNGEAAAALRQYERCRVALANELDVEPGTAIQKLYATLRANGKTAGAGERPTAVPGVHATTLVIGKPRLPHNLPQPPTLFVGRQAEINALIARLQDPACRLLTLIGAGGIGKTRLALEVARHLVDQPADLLFAEGIFFVDLLPVDTAAGMVATMAEAVGFTFYNNTPPQQQLFSYLKKRKLLLILDNFEQLNHAGELIVDLLAAAPSIKLLATSRETLPLHAAYFYAMQGLSYPSAQQTDIERAAVMDAVHLFAQSAQRHQPTFALPQPLESVVAICRLVGGMPLALELAAAWLKSLSCAQITQALEKGLVLLHTTVIDIPARHRNLRLVFEQSWQRLTAQEAAVMQRLALFRGGFTLAAAEQVAGAAIHTLATLVEKALIRLDETGRYQIHELLRQFAQEKLAVEPAHFNATAAAHADCFLNLAGQLKASLTDRRQQTALATMQADIDNLRVAWLWAMQHPAQPVIAQALDSFYAFFLFTCRYNEGKELFTTSQTLLENRSGLVTTLQTQLTTRASVFAYHLGEYEQPIQHFRVLLATDPGNDLQPDIAIAHMILGQIAGWQGTHAAAVAHFLASESHFQRLGDRSNRALALYRMAEMYEHAWDYPQVIQRAQECLVIGAQLRRNDLLANGHLTLGSAYRRINQPKLALEHYQQGCEYSQKTKDRLAYGLAVGGFGSTICQHNRKQWVQGFALLQQSLAICREVGHYVHTVTRLCLLGQASIHGKRYAEAISFAEECAQTAAERNYYKAIDFGLRTLAEGYYEMGDLVMSRWYIQKAVNIDIEHKYHGLTHDSVVCALLLEKEAISLTAMSATQNRIDAVMLATAALHRPAWYEYHQKAEDLLVRQKTRLSAKQFAAAQARADQHTLEVLATQILRLEPVQNYAISGLAST